MRDWTSLFIEGKPLYEQAVEIPPDPQNMTPEQILEVERQQLLNEGDFNEYRVSHFLYYKSVLYCHKLHELNLSEHITDLYTF